MRAITKRKEPASLTTHRKKAYGAYANLSATDKQKLREALVEEQRGICCYCMASIAASRDKMKIEHWQSQENYPDRQLDYSNLLGACLGASGQPKDKQHCDTRKGDLDLRFSPADPAHSIEQRVYFKIDGTIASTDAEFNVQLDDVLGLNGIVLSNRRKAVVDALVGWLNEYRRRHRRGPDAAALQRQRANLVPAIGHLKPYAQVAVWWLDQRLAKIAA